MVLCTKEAEDACGKYLVGTGTSAIRSPSSTNWATITLEGSIRINTTGFPSRRVSDSFVNLNPIVSVRDTVKRKTFLVRAGRKYLAAPKKRK